MRVPYMCVCWRACRLVGRARAGGRGAETGGGPCPASLSLRGVRLCSRPERPLCGWLRMKKTGYHCGASVKFDPSGDRLA